ncbi:post-transcriptional regulator [Virgibacillus necropolis]
MEIVRGVNEWKQMMEPALESKKSEFQLMGYSQASTEEIWNCLVQKVWKGNPSKRVYEVAQDIFHLASNVYLSYLTVKAYEDDDLMASIHAVTNMNDSKKEY